MVVPRLKSAALIVTAALGLSACGYNDGYGYSSVSIGYGNAGYGGGYYDDGYYDQGYYGRGYGYRDSYYGWYGDYYYPGVGIYVYDRYRQRHRWNDGHRRYWEGRRGSFYRNSRGYREDRHELRENWQGYRQERQDFRHDRRSDRRDLRRENRHDRRY